jgi:hypothetical protein
VSIVHPRLGSMLTGFAPSLCSIQQATTVQGDSGHAVKTWADVSGLTALRCQMKPAKASEVRTSDMVITNNAFRVALLAYYPTITDVMQAVIDSVAYNIIGIDHDSQHGLSYLTVERVTT